MGKVLFWIIAIIVILMVVRVISSQNAKGRSDTRQPKQAKKRGAPPIAHPESMVRCEHCGIHMPRSEAVLSNGRIWCSQEHAKLGVRQ